MDAPFGYDIISQQYIVNIAVAYEAITTHLIFFKKSSDIKGYEHFKAASIYYIAKTQF